MNRFCFHAIGGTPENHESGSGQQQKAGQNEIRPPIKFKQPADKRREKRRNGKLQQHLSIQADFAVHMPCRIASRDDIQQKRRCPHFDSRKGCKGHHSEESCPARLPRRGVEQRDATDDSRDEEVLIHSLNYPRGAKPKLYHDNRTYRMSSPVLALKSPRTRRGSPSSQRSRRSTTLVTTRRTRRPRRVRLMRAASTSCRPTALSGRSKNGRRSWITCAPVLRRPRASFPSSRSTTPPLRSGQSK